MKIYVSLSFIMLSISLFGQIDIPKESKAQKYKLKTIVQTKFDYESGKEVKQLLAIARFNEKGELVEYKEFEEDGKFVKHEKYEYNDDGDKIKETQMNSSGKVVKTNVYVYVDKLLKERVSYLPNGKIKNKKVYGYEYY